MRTMAAALAVTSVSLVTAIALWIALPLAKAEQQAGSHVPSAEPIIFPPPPHGIIFVVTSTGDGDDTFPGDGVCDDGTGNCTLRAAIEEANARARKDGIAFSIPTSDPGYDSSTGRYTIGVTKTLPLPDLSISTSISGPGPEKLTVRRKNSTAVRIFNVTATGTVSFSGMTIAGGIVVNDNGGAINNAGTGTVTVTNCTVTSNSAEKGGGINNASTGTVTVSNSILSHNSAGNIGGGINNDSSGTVNVTNSTLSGNLTNGTGVGGGIFNAAGGTVNVTNSTLSINSAYLGGGIFNAAFPTSGTVSVSNSTLNGNAAFGGGGGIYNEAGGIVNITDCTLTGNSAFGDNVELGGGGINNSGTLNITNSTLSGNFANGAGDGGGIFNRNVHSTVTVTNSTLSGNSASNEGGGIFNLAGGQAIVKSSIIALNTGSSSAPDVSGTFTSQGYNLIGKKDGSTGFTAATDQTGTIASPLDPKLDPSGLKNNGGPTQTVALLSGSPAINNGSPDAPPADQRGYFRNGASDIGAFEFEGGFFAVTLGNISTRALVGIGDEVMIGGFIISGTGNKLVLLRAIGPSLANPPINLTGTLQDPILSLFDATATMIASNDNWADAANAQSIDPNLRPGSALESAILISLAPGAYTAIVRGVNGGTGIGLVEVFDLDPSAASKLGNISTRGLVETGDSVMIGGFIVKGPNSEKVVVRAIGPSLASPPFNLSNVLQNPTLSLFDANGMMFAFNDDWRSTQEADIIATGLQPTNDAESAIVTTLTPGNYTAIVRGAGGSTGIALVEVYALN